MKKIVLAATGHPSTNPRIVKAADALKIVKDTANHLPLADRCNEDMVQCIKNNAGI